MNTPRTHLHLLGVELEDEHREQIQRKLDVKLGKFAPSIERVDVRVCDVNGPRGGVDLACRINVTLAGLPPVVFEERADSVEAAMDGAAAGVERAVRRRVQRRRMKPLRGRPGTGTA
jgi:ribosome-associated translation inhibitor RaiA